MEKKREPNCVFLPLESTVPGRSVRITMLFSSWKMKKLRKKCPVMYIRLGHLVVSIANCPPLGNVHSIALDILIAIAMCRRFCGSRGIGRLSFTHRIMVRGRLRQLYKVCNRLPMNKLVDEALFWGASVERLLPPFRFNLIFSPNVTDMALQMITSVFYGIHYMRDVANRSSNSMECRRYL